MPDPVDAHQLMATLRAQLTTLNKTVSACLTDAKVFTIEPYPGGEVPLEITPESHEGEKAAEIAQSAFRGLSRLDEQDAGSVIRTPGVVVVDRDLREVVEDVNDHKDRLRAFIAEAYPDPRARHHFVQKAFPGRVMLQAYRHIYTNDRPVERIRFTWSPYTETSKPISKKKALELLYKRNESGMDHTVKNRFEALRMAIEYVSASSANTKFAIKKPRSPFPKANIYFGKRDSADVPASLPLIIYSDQRTIDIADMPSFNQEKRRPPRSDKIPTELIFKPLYLYQLLPQKV